MQTTDNAIVNIPLSKRGDIDKQIDAYKREKAVEAKRARKAAATLRLVQKAEAKTKLAELVATDGLIDAKAAKLGVPRSELMAHLTHWVKWEPSRLIKLHAQWLAA